MKCFSIVIIAKGDSLLDTYDVLVLIAEDDLHCPLCGANADHLTVRNSEDNND